jgi:hypothetical protein
MNRPVDLALGLHRPSKVTIRGLWVEEVKRFTNSNETPLYVTLPGAHGLDISALVAEGLIRTTETGAIHPEDKDKVTAIEYDAEAVLALNRKFPGLNIVEDNLNNVLSGPTPFAWPPLKMREQLRGRVVNLDFNQAMTGNTTGGRPEFQLLKFVKKISSIQSQPQAPAQRRAWTLCLTVNTTCNWSDGLWRAVTSYLRSNCRRNDAFRVQVARLLGNDLRARIEAENNFSLREVGQPEMHRALSLLLPKLIIDEVNDHSWRVVAVWTYLYGDAPEAPMLTLAVRLEPDNDPITSAERYERNLTFVGIQCGRILADGVPTDF